MHDPMGLPHELVEYDPVEHYLILLGKAMAISGGVLFIALVAVALTRRTGLSAAAIYEGGEVTTLAKDVPMTETAWGVMPFLASGFIRIIFLVFFPVLPLGLIHVLG